MTRRFAWLGVIGLLTVVAACGGGTGGGGGGAATATPTPTSGGGGPPASAPASTVASGAPGSAAPSGDSTGSSGAIHVPDDACSVITDTDIKELFGGDVEAVENDDDEDNTCSFSVTNANGLLKDYAADTPQIVSVTFDEGYIGYTEEHAAMGDAVDQVAGLGREARIGLGAIHVDLGEENELVVTTVFGHL